jgi:hypothetical protein
MDAVPNSLVDDIPSHSTDMKRGVDLRSWSTRLESPNKDKGQGMLFWKIEHS